MKILFIYPEVGVGTRWTELLSIGVASALIKQAGHSVDLLHFKHPNQVASIKDVMPKIDPQLIVCHAAWDQWEVSIPILEEAKAVARKIPVIVSGPYASLDPDTVISVRSVDGLVFGETEPALNELVQRLTVRDPMWDLQNFWLKRKSKVVKNIQRMMIGNLDSLPFADRTLYDHAALMQGSGGGLPMQAGRGCPHECLFCYMPQLKRISSGKGSFVRSRSPMNLIGEVLELAKRQPFEWVDFVDEYFPQEMEWLDPFCSSWKTQVARPFRFTAVAEGVNPQSLQLLKEAGCSGFRLGVESGNEKFRQRISDRNIDGARIQALCDEARRLEMDFEIHCMTGLPLENPELAQETVDFARKLMPDRVQSHIFRPVRGSKLGEYCSDKDLHEQVAGSEFNPRRLSLKLSAITDEEVLRTFDQLRAINSAIALNQFEDPPGYFDFAKSLGQASAESPFQPAAEIAPFDLAEKKRLCLMQVLGSRIAFPATLQANSVLCFALAVGPSPFGFRQLKPIQVEVYMRQNDDEEMIYYKILKPGGKRAESGWVDLQLQLQEWDEGPCEIVLSVALMDAQPPAPMYVAWSRPFLTTASGQLVIQPEPPGETEIEAELVLDSPLGDQDPTSPEALQAEIGQLRDSNKKLVAETVELKSDIEFRKQRVGEMRIKQMEMEKAIETLRKEKQEWERLQQEQEDSGKKRKGFFKK